MRRLDGEVSAVEVSDAGTWSTVAELAAELAVAMAVSTAALMVVGEVDIVKYMTATFICFAINSGLAKASHRYPET